MRCSDGFRHRSSSAAPKRGRQRQMHGCCQASGGRAVGSRATPRAHVPRACAGACRGCISAVPSDERTGGSRGVARLFCVVGAGNALQPAFARTRPHPNGQRKAGAMPQQGTRQPCSARLQLWLELDPLAPGAIACLGAPHRAEKRGWMLTGRLTRLTHSYSYESSARVRTAWCMCGGDESGGFGGCGMCELIRRLPAPGAVRVCSFAEFRAYLPDDQCTWCVACFHLNPKPQTPNPKPGVWPASSQLPPQPI